MRNRFKVFKTEISPGPRAFVCLHGPCCVAAWLWWEVELSWLSCKRAWQTSASSSSQYSSTQAFCGGWWWGNASFSIKQMPQGYLQPWLATCCTSPAQGVARTSLHWHFSHIQYEKKSGERKKKKPFSGGHREPPERPRTKPLGPLVQNCISKPRPAFHRSTPHYIIPEITKTTIL